MNLHVNIDLNSSVKFSSEEGKHLTFISKPLWDMYGDICNKVFQYPKF
jgi:hypothetical protein